MRLSPCVSFGMLVSACSTLQPVQSAELMVPNRPTRVWVTTLDRATVVLDSASVRGDTLTGIVNSQREHFALSDITDLRVRERSEGRTALLGLGLMGVVGAVTLYTAESQGGGATGCCSGPLTPGCCLPEFPQ